MDSNVAKRGGPYLVESLLRDEFNLPSKVATTEFLVNGESVTDVSKTTVHQTCIRQQMAFPHEIKARFLNFESAIPVPVKKKGNSGILTARYWSTCS